MPLSDDIGKIAVVTVDALSPRGVRLLIFLLVCANGYGWWRHDVLIAQQAARYQALAEEVVGLRADVKAMVRESKDGTEELKDINRWLREYGTRGKER